MGVDYERKTVCQEKSSILISLSYHDADMVNDVVILRSFQSRDNSERFWRKEKYQLYRIMLPQPHVSNSI